MTTLNHCFSVEHAAIYGIECAILIAHFQFWIDQNKRLERNFFDGRTWMYQTQTEISAIYPYWNRDKVQDILKRLVKFGVLIKGNYNKTQFDKTQWYAFKNEEMFTIVRFRTIDGADQHNPLCQPAQPIPDTKTNTEQIQQQGASPPLPPVAVFSKKSERKQLSEKSEEPKIHECLKKIDISDHDKIELTNRYDEDTVRNAINWATHEKTKLTKGLAPALKWACQARPEVPKNEKEQIEQNKAYAMKYDGMRNEVAKIEVLNAQVEILYPGAQSQHPVLKYTEKDFIARFKAELAKARFKVIGEN